MKDVAAHAGVSVSAVSYALNEKSSVPLAADTKERIRLAAAELGYVPNGVARSLKARSSGTFGVILDKPLTVPRYAGIVQGIGAGLRSTGSRVSIISGGSTQGAVADVRSGLLDGLVFIGHDDQGVPPVLLDQVVTHDVPFVAMDCGMDAVPPTFSTVDFDYGAGAREVLEHLLAVGVDRIIYVRPDLTTRAETERARAIAGVLQHRPDLTIDAISDGVDETVLRRLDESGDGGWFARALADGVGRALRRGSIDATRTAVVCAWGSDAEGAYAAARAVDAGIRVVSLAAGTLADALWPNLAYSRLPLETAGRECARLIVRAAPGGAVPEHVLLAPRLDVTAPSPNDITTDGGIR